MMRKEKRKATLEILKPNNLKNNQVNIVGIEQSKIDTLWSQMNILDGFPEAECFQNVIYIPEDMGLYTQEGIRIDVSCLCIKNTNTNQWIYRTAEKIEYPKKLKKIKGKFIYVEDLFVAHYGHFLTQGISRLWYLAKNTEHVIICHKRPKLFRRKNFIDFFLETIDLNENNFISFNEPCLIEEVIVPKPSMILFDSCYENHKLIPENVANRLINEKIKSTNQPLYLSRNRLKSKQRLILQENELEEKLKEKGVCIAYPETLSLRKQIELLNKHEVIIGTIGSALHGLLFDISAQRNLVCLVDETLLNTTFLMIDMIKSINSTYIATLKVDTQNTSTNKSSTHRNLDLEMTLKIFKELNLI